MLPITLRRRLVAVAGDPAVLLRKAVRRSEPGLIILSAVIGVVAALVGSAIGATARNVQAALYGLDAGARLSGLPQLAPLSLVALPLGGLAVGLAQAMLRERSRTAVDVVEANALHGGRIPLRDTLFVTLLTVLSNGSGASVGLEAAYAQAGGGLASAIGQWLRLRRTTLREVVGAGAGAAIAAAFGAPLTGAFYAFEIVIGAYTPAAIAPVAAAAISAAVTARWLGATPYLIVLRGNHAIATADYLIYAALGLAAALFGIAMMRLVTGAEAIARRLSPRDWLRPAIGGALLVPIAWACPQALSAGHGALHLTLDAGLLLGPLAFTLGMKAMASIVSLGSGFRGGLFFASLLLGALLGQALAMIWMMVPGAYPLDLSDAALVGMAALAVAVVGGPMTMSLLVLEATHNFAITATVLTAVLCSSALVRDRFGYSFSTWRLHLRGEVVRSARDIGWMRSLTAQRLMRAAPPLVAAATAVAEFQRRFPLGSTSRVILVDQSGRYAGLIPTADAFRPGVAGEAAVEQFAVQQDVSLKPDDAIEDILQRFDDHEADDLAVLDGQGRPIGLVTEKYVRRRFASEADRALREAYGEA